jgi:hypothetical protein
MRHEVLSRYLRTPSVIRGADDGPSRLSCNRSGRELAASVQMHGRGTSPGCYSWNSIIILTSAVLFSACGGGPPSIAEANRALKEAPDMQLVLGDQSKNTALNLISDLKCEKSGDQQFKCQILLPKNPLTGTQETIPVGFVKLDGKWREIPTG